MRLRQGDGWVPVYDLLALDWIDRGCSEPGDEYQPTPAAVVAGIKGSGASALPAAPD
jgi:hypothetical protein